MLPFYPASVLFFIHAFPQRHHSRKRVRVFNPALSDQYIFITFSFLFNKPVLYSVPGVPRLQTLFLLINELDFISKLRHPLKVHYSLPCLEPLDVSQKTMTLTYTSCRVNAVMLVHGYMEPYMAQGEAIHSSQRTLFVSIILARAFSWE